MAKGRVVAGKHLVQLRKKQTRVSQKVFSELVDIPVGTLRNYEQGRSLLTVEKFMEIKSKLGYVSDSKNRVRVMIDYLRITFKHVEDLSWFCQEYLYCDLKDFISVETKMMNYTHLWKRGDIWIFDFADKSLTNNYQITVQLSGAGCRQFELTMERAGTDWARSLQKMAWERKDMKVTRLDIAMDEPYKGVGRESEQFDLFSMLEKRRKREIVLDRIENFSFVGGGAFDETKGKQDGLSLYFGSRQSSMFFNFYEKRYELAKKERVSVDEASAVFDIWNRYELRFSDEKAHSVVDEFINGVDIAEIAKGILNKELQVYDGLNSYGAYLPDKKWQELFGGVEPLKLSTCPEPYDILRTVKWLVYQVSNSLALVSEADKKLATDYLKMIFESGEIGEKEEKVLEQLSPEDKRYIDEIFGKVV
ncbi:Cro/Cl family transcriptional regulator [Streptococcus minor]|uniref:Cro/Cl family transcriptional regulator n=1 Tax=Streptococcus minor TaxID=229549 RepID=A0A3P1VB99_9STRE|nr:replication initiation factor domain-containing protein [Streptococcus minor]RRD31494.1 Cro/Cl family transcriptional regulator [Streptococcus minor]